MKRFKGTPNIEKMPIAKLEDLVITDSILVTDKEGGKAIISMQVLVDFIDSRLARKEMKIQLDSNTKILKKESTSAKILSEKVSKLREEVEITKGKGTKVTKQLFSSIKELRGEQNTLYSTLEMLNKEISKLVSLEKEVNELTVLNKSNQVLTVKENEIFTSKLVEVELSAKELHGMYNTFNATLQKVVSKIKEYESTTDAINKEVKLNSSKLTSNSIKKEEFATALKTLNKLREDLTLFQNKPSTTVLRDVKKTKLKDLKEGEIVISDGEIFTKINKSINSLNKHNG